MCDRQSRAFTRPIRQSRFADATITLNTEKTDDCMADAYKKLYDAQVREHEKTNAALRKAQKENANMRGLFADQEKRYQDAIKLLHQIAKHILRDYPLDEPK